MTFQYYWTSTTNAADISKAWTVFSCDFGTYDTRKDNSGYTLAVRSAIEETFPGILRQRQ